MSLAQNKPVNSRLLRDNLIKQSSAVPTPTPSFDLFQVNPYPTPEQFVVRVTAGTVTSTFDFVTHSIVLEHSDDNVTFVSIPTLGSTVSTDTLGSGGTDPVTASYSMPPDVKRYVRAAPYFYSGSNSQTYSSSIVSTFSSSVVVTTSSSFDAVGSASYFYTQSVSNFNTSSLTEFTNSMIGVPSTLTNATGTLSIVAMF
jgi:hypothetical protein